MAKNNRTPACYTRSVCVVDGCSRLQRFKQSVGTGKTLRKRWDKYCNVHHKIKFPKTEDRFIRSKNFLYVNHIDNSQCFICGWNEGPCDRHRLNPEFGYIKGNVVSVCPNHHRLITLGIRSYPNLEEGSQIAIAN